MTRFSPLRRSALGLFVWLASGAWVSADAQSAPLPVVASFSILGDIVHQIGGADVQVSTLVGPDGDAHSYEPTPADAKRLGSAQVLFVNGLGFETWLPGLTRSSGYKGTVVVASEGVQTRRFEDGAVPDAGHGKGHEPGHGAGHEPSHEVAHAHGHDEAGGHHHDLDPHAWQSLANGRRYAQNVADGLVAADPAHAQAYRERAAAYIARIDALEAAAQQAFAAIPAERRQVVTSHDAFGYFGDAYRVKFIPVAGVSTQAEPSAADMARIVTQVRQEKVPAVFVENITNPRLAQQIAREAGAKVGGTLYSDALSRPGTPGATYLGMFEWNVRQISTALQP